MEIDDAVAGLSALAQPTRLAAFRALVAAGEAGIAAGDLARRLGVPQNTLSSHLNILAQAELVVGTRDSRSIVYRAQLEHFRSIMTFLIQDCCGGRPELCVPLLAELTPCCPPSKESVS